MATHFEGAASHSLVQEDVGNTFDVRAWMKRPQVSGRDGTPLAPDGDGAFSRLKPNCQYRLESSGTRKVVVASAGPVAGSFSGSFANVTLREEASLEDKAMCTCVVGKVCATCAALSGA